MPKKIHPYIIELIEELYALNMSPKEIAQRAQVSKTTVYSHTKLKERGFASPTEYKKYLVQQNQFLSINQYEIYLAQKRGYSSRVEYEKHLVQERDFTSYADYKKHLVQEKGFASITEYGTYLAQERQQKIEYQKLSNLVRQRLKKLGKTQLWLAIELGVTPQAVCKYANGTSIPKKNILTKLYSSLGVPYKTIDNLLE